jgi:hypothetical protein
MDELCASHAQLTNSRRHLYEGREEIPHVPGRERSFEVLETRAVLAARAADSAIPTRPLIRSSASSVRRIPAMPNIPAHYPLRRPKKEPRRRFRRELLTRNEAQRIAAISQSFRSYWASQKSKGTTHSVPAST